MRANSCTHVCVDGVKAGDATNFVLVFAGELLAKAEQLLRMGLHPSEIVEGYEKASAQALSILQGKPCPQASSIHRLMGCLDISIDTVTQLNDVKQLEKVILGPLSSKQVGLSPLLSLSHALTWSVWLVVWPRDHLGARCGPGLCLHHAQKVLQL